MFLEKTFFDINFFLILKIFPTRKKVNLTVLDKLNQLDKEKVETA